MIDWLSRLLLVLLLVVALLFGWGTLLASRALASSFSLLVFLIAHLILLLDSVDLMLRLYFRRLHTGGAVGRRVGPCSIPLPDGRLSPYQKRLHTAEWAIVVSLFDAEPELDDFLEAMEPYRNRLWVVDDGSRDQTLERLRRAGVRCLETGTNRRKPAALRQLLQSLPAEVETVLVLDPDCRILNRNGSPLSDLEEVIFDLQRSGAAAASPRVTIRDGGWFTRLQRFEYWVAFSIGRKSLGDQSITPGVALYRRDALEHALSEHSLSVYAEDLENSFILLGAGERIYYDGRLVIETEAKATLAGWFSQRVGWAYGFIRAYTHRFEEVRRLARRRALSAYQYLIYMGVGGLLLHPLRVLEVGVLSASFGNSIDNLFAVGLIADNRFTDPAYFSTAYLSYTALVLLALMVGVGRRERLELLAAVPFYFFYVLLRVVTATVGYANWLSVRWLKRRLFRDHYQDELSLLREEAVGHTALGAKP